MYCLFFEKARTIHYIGGAMELELEITSLEDITAVVEYTWAALLPLLRTLPGIGNKKTAYEVVMTAGQLAYAEGYKYVYFVNIAFGGVCIIASCLWGDIKKYMDNHVAVVMR